MNEWMQRFLLAAALVVLAACGQPTINGDAATGAIPSANPMASDSQQQAAAQRRGLQAVLATSEVVVGPNRVALGVLEDNHPIADAAQTKLKARYFKLNGNQATLIGEEDARYYGEGLGERGTFIIHPSFDAPGPWGLEIVIERPGKPAVTQRLQLDVLAKGSAPKIGEAAPKSKTPTAQQVKDLTTITSDTKPDSRLYQMSVDQAVTSGKPSLILFATPGYCQTAVCGPGVDVLSKLADTFGDKVNAVHVEVYRLPYEGRMVPAMQQWGLQTEPWLFLVDKDGKIAGRYEGGITFEELQPEVAKLVQ